MREVLKIRDLAFHILLCSIFTAGVAVSTNSAEITGVTVTPHVIAESMKYRRPREADLAAKVHVFVKGKAIPGTFNGRNPADLLKSNEWAWHNLGTAIKGKDDTISVWTFNGRSSRWGVGQSVDMEGDGLAKTRIELKIPGKWISAITFQSNDSHPQPSEIFVHIVNQSARELNLNSLALWLPESGKTWQTLYKKSIKQLSVKIPANDRGFIRILYPEKLPLTYTAIEINTDQGSLWEHIRIKSEHFDISGGWIGDHLRQEAYLKLLSGLHVNCGQIQDVGGYTDNLELSASYPMKMFNRMMPLEKWDSDKWLPKIHAVEFLGEPQYGGGRPVPPQEVFEAFLPYRTSRLATSVTHSEERVWRYYAGLSDFPHYDAYRVVAPAADSWRDYDRWGDRRITWGAPLETIGDMSSSLRDINRPMPVSFWAQGPHDGWGGGFRSGGRSRRSPTPDELRSQAMHALSTRITSLYWFNLSLKSLMKFPDTWEPMQRIGREIKMLSPFYISGDAGFSTRLKTADGKPDWDISTIVSPEAAVLFANDLAYYPDEKENVFKFSGVRDFNQLYPLPHWLRGPVDVFRVDADGIHEVKWKNEESGVRITTKCSRDAIFIATQSSDTRRFIETRRQDAIAWELKNKLTEADLAKLQSLLQAR